MPHARRAKEAREKQGIQTTESATEREEERQRPHRTCKGKSESNINNGCKCEREIRKREEVDPSKRPSPTEKGQRE